jgi:glycosyltransferase involved in cell wall biosynthesis
VAKDAAMSEPESAELRALLVSYTFPPIGGAGVARVLKLSKYLGAHGVSPAVLTVENPSVPVFDSTLEREVPEGMPVLRARTLEFSYKVKQAMWTTRAARRLSGARRAARALVSLGKELLFPDPQVLWQPGAQATLTARLLRHDDDVVFISGPPFSQFLLAPVARLRPGVAVVLDYRDEWSTYRETYEMISRLGALTGEPLETWLLRSAHAVTTATEAFRENLLDRFSFLRPERVFAIPNGYDPQDFPAHLPSPPTDRFVVTYAGTIFRLTSPRGFLGAVRRLHQAEPELAKLLDVRFLGRVVDTELDAFEGMEALGVRRLGYVAHERVISELAASHLVLCLLDAVPGVERIYPAKIFELMYLGRQCLTLSPPGALTELVARHHLGDILPPGDEEKIAAFLSRTLRAFRDGTLPPVPRPIGIERYNRLHLAGEFAEVFRKSVAWAGEPASDAPRPAPAPRSTPKRSITLRPPSEVGADVLRGRDMLCFSHDWTGDPLSKTHLMRLLARDNRVLWVNSIGYRAPTASAADLSRAVKKVAAAAARIQEPERNIFVNNSLVIPAYGIPEIRALNRRLLQMQVKRAMQHLGFKRPINWVFNPAAGVIAGDLGEDLLIYYCVDEYTAFAGVPSRSLVQLEGRLLSRADLVIVSAERLYKSKSKANPRTVLVRHGVNYEHFRKALAPETKIPDDIAKLPRPIIGYFGLMGADWVDIDLLSHVAKHFSGGSLVLIGKQTMDLSKLERMPNVHLVGRKPYETLPAYCKGFDVSILPFPISEVTLNANPLKVREYLAAGLPVVSTPIPEVEVLGKCLIGTTPEAFVEQIEVALANPGPRLERSLSMQSESWEARIEEIRRHVASIRRDDGPPARDVPDLRRAALPGDLLRATQEAKEAHDGGGVQDHEGAGE